tara:strand:- start:3015 stop:4421 length:1407 start_codon:yes stop_codon:yes gene_type:complete
MVDLPFGANATRRVPTAVEASTGFPCGAADQSLFNFLAWLSSRNAIPTAVNSATTSAEPGSPAAGDAYIIPDGATGSNWTGQADKVAMWTGADWVFWDVAAGTILVADDEDVFYRRTASGWLAYPLVQVIREDTEITVGTDTGDDFATFAEAFEWLSNYRIAVGYTVTVSVGAQTFTLDGSGESLSFSHPDGIRIEINGATLLGSFPSQSAWAANGGGSSTRATDLAANVTLAESVLASRVYCDNGATVLFTGHFKKISNLGFFGDGTAVDGLVISGGTSEVENVVALGFGGKNLAFQAAQSTVSNIVGCGGQHGVIAISGSHLTCPSGYIAGFNASIDGVTASQMSAIYCTSGNIYAGGCEQYGVRADSNAGITAGSASQSRNSTSASYAATLASRVNAPGATSIGTPSVGFYSNEGSFIGATGCTASGTTYYLANRGSSIDAGSGSVGASSPTVNTVGNENSYISQ